MSFFTRIPSEHELWFIEYFDKFVDPNDVFNNINDLYYLESKDYIDSINACLIMVKEQINLYYRINIVRCWELYCEYKSVQLNYNRITKNNNE